MSYCGLRWGEATKLRPADLDLFRKRVSIPRNAVRTGDAIVVGTPKSHETRTVPLTADLVRLLAQQCDGKGRDDLLFPNRSGGYCDRANGSGLPAVRPTGR